MHGTVRSVLRKTDFNYSFLQGTSNTNEFIVANTVSISGYNRIGMSVRVHELDIAGSTANFVFQIRGVNPSAEDGRDFVRSTVLGSSSSLTASISPPALGVLTAVIANPQTPFIRVVLRGQGDAGAATGAALYAQLSADLKMWMA